MQNWINFSSFVVLRSSRKLRQCTNLHKIRTAGVTFINLIESIATSNHLGKHSSAIIKLKVTFSILPNIQWPKKLCPVPTIEGTATI